MPILISILLPFFGTVLGSSMVFLIKKEINNKLQKFLLGFAAGVMIAASIWSLIMPAIELSGHLGRYRFFRQVLWNIKAYLCSYITNAFDFVFYHPLVTVERDFQFFHLSHDFFY